MGSAWKQWRKRTGSEASTVSATSSFSSVASQRGSAAPAAVRGPLAHRPYYHGLLCREDVASMLQTPGDFIVRTSDVDARVVLVVSVRLADDIKHVIVEQDAGHRWTVQKDRTFTSPEDLIDFYQATGEPLDGPQPGAVRLQHGVARQSWELTADQVQLRQRIGSGAFGEVHAALLLVDLTRYMQCAVKLINNPSYVSKAQREEFMREARLMRNYEHSRVIKLYGVVAETGRPLMVVMELATGGNLLNHIRLPHNAALSAKARVTYAHEAAEGMRYLEKQHCIHRDLAARNCLLDAGGHVKLSDFGLSVESETGRREDESSAMRCAIRWQAPEVLAERTFTTKSDVWSFAVLLYEVLSNGREPYPDYSVADARLNIMIGRLRPMPPPANMDGPGAPPATPPQVAKLMEQMAATDPDKRPTFLVVKLKLRKILKKME